MKSNPPKGSVVVGLVTGFVSGLLAASLLSAAPDTPQNPAKDPKSRLASSQNPTAQRAEMVRHLRSMDQRMANMELLFKSMDNNLKKLSAKDQE